MTLKEKLDQENINYFLYKEMILLLNEDKKQITIIEDDATKWQYTYDYLNDNINWNDLPDIIANNIDYEGVFLSMADENDDIILTSSFNIGHVIGLWNDEFDYEDWKIVEVEDRD